MLDRRQAYQVHLGAFRDAQAAERLRSIVSNQGFEIAIVERPLGNGETWLLAVSGDFADRTEALRLAARLHGEIGIDPLVVRAPAITGDAG
jgi:cell division protein FtsN